MNGKSKHLFEYQGRKVGIKELAELTGLSVSTMRGRLIDRGMTVEEAVKTPRKGHVRCTADTWEACFTCQLPDCVKRGLERFPDEPKAWMDILSKEIQR